MLVVMKNDATKEQVQVVIEEIEKMGFRASLCPAPKGPPSALSAIKAPSMIIAC